MSCDSYMSEILKMDVRSGRGKETKEVTTSNQMDLIRYRDSFIEPFIELHNNPNRMVHYIMGIEKESWTGNKTQIHKKEIKLMNLKAKNNIKRKKEIKERTPPTDQLRKQQMSIL